MTVRAPVEPAQVLGASTDERWLPVLGAPGYEVSDQGRARSVDRTLVDRLGRRRSYLGQVLTPIYMLDHTPHQYVRVGGQLRFVHHLVLEAFVGPRPVANEALHWNDTADDNRLTNLRWGTRLENVADAVRNGRRWQEKATHCPYDHELVMPNLTAYHASRGCRACKACHWARGTVIRASKRGQQLDHRAVADGHYARILRETGGNTR